jgi:hypothetical protein
MILSSHGLIASQIASFDADALAFFARVTAAGGTLSATEKIATNQLVLDLKANSLWTPMKAIYPMVGASAAACAQNLKSSSFTGTFTSGWTFASTGVTPNGTSAYFDTGLNPSINLSNVNSNHQAVYLRTGTTQGTYVDIGQTNPNWLSAIYWAGGSTFIYNPTNSQSINTPNTNALGLSINTRRSSTDFVFFCKNSKIGSNIILNTSAFASANVYIGSAGTSLYSNRQNAFASIGDGLTDTQASNFYTAVQAFQTTLSRNV